MIVVSLAREQQCLYSLSEMARLAALPTAIVDNVLANWHCEQLLVPASVISPQNQFERIAVQFDSWLEQDNQIMVLVADVYPLAMNPLLPGYESLLAMLILAFPEVRWLFGTIRGYDGTDTDDQLDKFRKAHGLHHLFQPWQTPLFDGAGLRDWVRQCCSKQSDNEDSKKDAAYVPLREQLAVAMDEETDYAYLHAYTAYRFGFRAMALTRWNAVDAVLGENAVVPSDNLGIVLEDLYLNFPDGGKGMSALTMRADTLPRLKDAEHRILITSGHRVVGDKKKIEQNREHIADQKSKGKRIGKLYKPHGGIFSIWEDSGLKKQLKKGVGKGYVWPPDWKAITREFPPEDNDENHGHSSPGVLLQVARHLLNRAERLLANPITTAEEAVRGAVLATDALELLGGKTPTSAAEALALKHQFAIHAECQFVGVEHRIRLTARFEEIRRDAKSIAHWFRPKERKRATLNIEMDVINRIIKVLREYNQFDEELVCINRVRNLHNSLYMSAKSKPWRILAWPILRYTEFLLSSFSRFAVAIGLWLLSLSALYTEPGYTSDAPSQLKPAGKAIELFLGSAPLDTGLTSLMLSVLVIIAGLAHLGIFISHLYVLVSKR